MKKLALMTLFAGSIFLAACSQPTEQEAISKQDDIAVVDGFCTELTVTTLNKIQAATPSEAAEPCQQLQSLLKGRTCRNQDQIFPEVEHNDKCELALKSTAVLQTAPAENPTPMPISTPTTVEENQTIPNSCSSEVVTAFKDLKNAKFSLDKKTTRTRMQKALKQCHLVSSLVDEKPCLAKDSKTGEVKELNLKSAGLSTFCEKLKASQKK